MPLPLSSSATTLLVRKSAFERSGLTRVQIDQALTLTDNEFRVEKDLVAIGPVFDDDGLAALVEALRRRSRRFIGRPSSGGNGRRSQRWTPTLRVRPPTRRAPLRTG